MRGWAAAVVGAGFLLWTASGSAGEPDQAASVEAGVGAAGESGEVTVNAETIIYDEKANTIEAMGNVRLRRGPTTLKAERVRIYRKTEEAEAEGNVVVTSPEAVISGSRLQLNLEDETGRIEDAEVFFPERRYTLRGRCVTKGLGQSYRIEEGELTTCQCGEGEEPSWSMAGEEVDVTLEGYARVRGGRFKIGGVPVLALPYLLLPARRERHTGLLLPRLGFSVARGAQLLQPFYWNIEKHRDLTFTLDLESAARIGGSLQYRYQESLGTGGEAEGSYLNEKIRGKAEVVNPELADPEVPADRWSVSWRHGQTLPGGVDGYANIFVVSDDLFLRDMNTLTLSPEAELALRTQRFTTSRVGFTRRWPGAIVWGEGEYFQDLIRDDDFTLHRLPAIHVWGDRWIADGRALVDLRAEGVRFERREGLDGARFDLRPQASVPFRIGDYLYGALSGTVRETAYLLDDRRPLEKDGQGLADGPPLPATSSRELFTVAARLGTRLQRVYAVGGSTLEKLRHTIEPSLRYLYVPDVEQEDLPLFDYTDRVRRRNLFTYGITTRLLGKFLAGKDTQGPARPAGAIRELGSLTLAQTYDLGSAGAAEGGLSDLEIAFRSAPLDYLGFLVSTTQDVGDGVLRAAQVAFSITDPRDLPQPGVPELRRNSSLAVSYQFIDENRVEELNTSVILRLTRHWSLAYQGRYNAVAGEFLENRYGLRVSSACDCWAVDLGVIDKVNPDEVEFRLLVNLLGLASFGRSVMSGPAGALPAGFGGGTVVPWLQR